MQNPEEFRKRLFQRHEQRQADRATTPTNARTANLQSDKETATAVSKEKAKREIATLAACNERYGIQQRLEILANVINQPVIVQFQEKNLDEHSIGVKLLLSVTYKTWKGRPIVSVSDGWQSVGSGMSFGGGPLSHEEPGSPTQLSNQLIISLDPSDEGEVVIMQPIHKHWSPAEKYYEFQKTKGSFIFTEQPVALYTLLDMTGTHEWAISDIAQAAPILDDAFIDLYDAYLAAI